MLRKIKNIKNYDILINELGIVIPAKGEIDFMRSDFHVISSGQEIFDLIDAGELLLQVNNAIISDGIHAKNYFTHVSSGSSDAFEVRAINQLNPSDMEFAIIANMLRVDFQQHLECASNLEQHQNIVAIFGNDFNVLESTKNIELVGGNFQLYSKAEAVVVDACSTLDNLVLQQDNGSSVLGIGTDDGLQYWQIRAQGEGGSTFSITKTCSANSWRQYKKIRVKLQADASIKVVFMLNGFYEHNSWMWLKPGTQEISFDITNLPKESVTSYGLYIQAQDGFTEICCNEILGQSNTANYATAGEILFATINFANNNQLDSLFFYPYDDVCDGTEIKYNISLDNGINWHPLTGNEIAAWLQVDNFANFVGTNSLKLMVEFVTTTPQKTPILDDFFLMYRLRQGE